MQIFKVNFNDLEIGIIINQKIKKIIINIAYLQ